MYWPSHYYSYIFQKNSIGMSIFSYGTLAKMLCFVWDCTGTNIDDHGSLQGDTAKILARQQHPVASVKPWACGIGRRMPHWPGGAPWSSKPNQNNQWNHLLNCIFLVYYSYIVILHYLALTYQGHMVGRQKGDTYRFPSLPTSSGLHHWGYKSLMGH